jgi:hypothetical protein
MIGLERSSIVTVVERTTGFMTLVHLPREEGYRHKHTIKTEPALAGYGAITMKNACQHDVGATRAAGAVAALGPREGEVGTRPVQD